MTTFWLATFEIGLPKGDLSLGPILAARTPYLAIEILRRREETSKSTTSQAAPVVDERWAVLFSSVNDPDSPQSATCLLGFSNVARACNTWLDRGFPLVDAVISEQNGVVTIVSPFFEKDETMQYGTTLLTLSGVDFGVGHQPASQDFGLSYNQFFMAPDGAQPDVLINQEPVEWAPTRGDIKVLASAQPEMTVTCPSRLPSLAPFSNATLRPKKVWSGTITLPDQPKVAKSSAMAPLQKKAHVFGIPSFRFEDVEILGFRIDLAKLGHDKVDVLEPLIAPLNFHLTQRGSGSRPVLSMPDFRYRAATCTVVIELLRYGRMKAKVPRPPMAIGDSQAQHELMVRVLVGRVDDDSAQARAPAVHVPAIFVDNPWSKILGRDAIGFDKRMASFFAEDADGNRRRLRPDGRQVAPPAGATPIVPLGEISHVELNGMAESGGAPLLELNYSTNDHTDPMGLQAIDLDLAFGRNSIVDTRWRQSDFGDEEFRRSFARTAVADSIRSFRSIQAAPVVARGRLEPAWINGTFLLDADVQASIPAGVATLTFHQIPSEQSGTVDAPKEAWNHLCSLLTDGRISLMRGSWYRLHCSMDLTIDDGLDWSGVHR